MFEAPSIRILAGSTAVFGLFWASWALSRRGRGAKAGLAQPAVGEGSQALAREEALEQAAIEDALRDMREMREAREKRERRLAELQRSPRRDPDEIDDDDIDEMDLDLEPSVGYLDPTGVPEPYDAVDAENVGADWLLRATQASAPSRRDASDLPEGTHIIEPNADEGEPAPSTHRSPDSFGAPVSRDAPVSESERAIRNAWPQPPRRP